MLGILYRFAELMGKFIDLLGRWRRLLVDGVDGEGEREVVLVVGYGVAIVFAGFPDVELCF